MWCFTFLFIFTPFVTVRSAYNEANKSIVTGESKTEIAKDDGIIDENFVNQTNDEKKLIEYLLRNYDTRIRPLMNASKPVVVKLGILLKQIYDLDEKNQVLTTNVWLDQEWKDEFLRWDPAQFGNIKKLNIPCDTILLPDIVLYNKADEFTEGYMQTRAMVHPDGTVFWPPPTKLSSSCPIDVTYFPFDDQVCELEFASWIHDGFQIDLHNSSSHVDLSKYIQHSKWILLDTNITRNVVYFPCCPEPFNIVKVTLILRRKTLYYLYNIVVPCIMLSILTLFVFYLPPDSGEKVSLGVTILLAFSLFMLVISEKLPETSDSIPLLGLYLTAMMTITSISVIMTVLVLNLHYRGPIDTEVPEFLKKRFLPKSLHNYMNENSGVYRNDDLQRKRLWEERRGKPKVEAEAELSLLKKAHTMAKEEEQITRNGNMDHWNSLNTLSRSCSDERRKHIGCYKIPKVVNRNEELPRSSNEKCQDEMFKALSNIVQRQENEQVYNISLNKWRIVALAIDKMLFWIFLIITTISSVLFLVIIPLYRRNSLL